MVYLPCHLKSSPLAIAMEFGRRRRCFRSFFSQTLFLGAENLDRAMAKSWVNEENRREKNLECRKEQLLGAPKSCDLKPNNMVILIKYDNYTQSAIFLCKCSSFPPLHRTSGALPERLESLRSAEAPSRGHRRFCSRASSCGATDCQPLKPALQPRLSSACRRR